MPAHSFSIRRSAVSIPCYNTDVRNPLTADLRELDVCTRYGGEEFFIVLPHTPDGEVFEIAERIRIKIRNYLENSFQVTISIGMATISPHITALVDLIKIADTALYASKESGRNRTTRGTLPAEITS